MAHAKSEFYFQIAQMLEAGLTLPKALTAMLPQASGPLRKRLEKALEFIHAGEIPYRAFDSAGFSKLEVALLRVAEKTGGFPDCFRDLAGYAHTMEKFRRKLISGLAYPVLLIVIAPLILGLPDIFTKNLSFYLKNLFFTYGSMIAVVFGAVVLHKTLCKSLPLYVDILNQTPVLGKLRMQLALARFCYSSSALLGGGVLADASLNLAAEATGNLIYQQKIQSVTPAIARGESIYEQLSTLSLFPSELLEFVRTGEVSGKLPESLKKMGDMYIGQAELALSWISKILPGVVYAAVVIQIASKILSFYQGYFSKLGSF